MYIYIMWTAKYFWLFKLGISKNPRTRAKYIEQSMNNRYSVYVVHSNSNTFAYFWEQSFHFIFKFCNYRWIDKKISGHTEFFFILILPIALLWLYIHEIIVIVSFLYFAYYISK